MNGLTTQSLNSSGDLKTLDRNFVKNFNIKPDKRDIAKSLYSSKPEIYELANKELQDLYVSIDDEKALEPFLDLAILKNDAFQQLNPNK